MAETCRTKLEAAVLILSFFFQSGIIIPISSECSGEECRSIVFKEPIQDKVIKGHLIRLEEVPHQGSCNVLCYMEPSCVSINVGPSQAKGGNYICELNNASDEIPGSSYLQSKEDYSHLSIENPCSSSPCFNNGTCRAGYTDKGFRCKCPLGFTGVHCEKACSLDFEDGIGRWKMTGRAFIYQPTFGDNPVARKRESAQLQGNWWVGGAEKRTSESDPAGGECRSIIFKEPIQDRVLKGRLIRLEEVPHQGSCNLLCHKEPNCVSINVGPSQGGSYTCELNNASDESPSSFNLQSKQDYTHLSIENPCRSSSCFNNGTCQAGYTDKGFRCKCPLGFTGVYCKRACSFDFEDGVGGWEMTGRAFIYQPTFGDKPVARNKSAQPQGDWWVGGAEKRPNESFPVGGQHPDEADKPHGTLTSLCFRIVGKNISFLIGGGCKVNEVRAELIVNNQIVRKETGNCLENMTRKSWDVEEFIGQYAQVKLVDETSGSWGHINFDDLKGDIICPHDFDGKN
ncbi:Pikachurin [Stylophora pistillata]|uniref:Pikachurin n=1 Tax=Stylophora pistillata TaxID=50429 RepID=A0A2B4RJX9_STYPI|nr:Pikachurin [Stylophora pistillata]